MNSDSTAVKGTQNIRALAAQTLAPVLNQKSSLILRKPQNPIDQGIYAELCYGTLRLFPRLDLIVQNLLSRDLKKQDADVRGLILIGLYQIDFMRVPDHAALDQTVEAAGALGKKWAKSLINGVLRNYLRQRDALLQKLSQEKSFNTAMPEWLMNQWQTCWPEDLDDIVNAAKSYPPMHIRVNRQKQGRQIYQEHLKQAGIEAQQTVFSQDGLILNEAVSVTELPGFFEGDCSVQDEAAQLCAPLLQLAPGQRVLDACAAPGGKTLHLLECCPDIELLAMDISAKRLADVQSNLERSGLAAELHAGDAAKTETWWDGRSFDRILLDAPCSGTGVIRRHPDIKVLRRPSDINSFRQQQQKLLDALWPTLGENGLLLYVTCSIMPDENEALISLFLQQHANVEVMPISSDFGRKLPIGRQLLPSPDGADGFYFALLRKTGGSE